MNKEYGFLGLYEHNLQAYKKVKSAFTKDNVVGIVHATGTGKSYIGLQLAYDNKNKKTIYVVPSLSIVEHLQKILAKTNVFLPNLEFQTYQSFVNLSKEEMASIPCDLLILDEFHHLGAPIWGARINTFIETHPNIKIFGLTAYTIRDRHTPYERDMANPETQELFSGKIASYYDLCSAILEGTLPKPIYKSAYIHLKELEETLERKVAKLSSKDKESYQQLLEEVKRKIHTASNIKDLLKKNIKPTGKYIYFCPPANIEGENDIETIKNQALEWFKEIAPESEIIFYTSTSEMGELGKKNREAFYNDTDLNGNNVDQKLRIMLAINQYNEGNHAPNIDGVIMGRATSSDIVYFEQLGRALNVRGNTIPEFARLEKLSLDELIKMCEQRDIKINDNTSKEELIEKLIAPVIIDLTNNLSYIKELENNLTNRLKEITSSNSSLLPLDIKITDASFDIEIANQDLYETLRYVMDRLTMTWDDYYEYAKAYYEHYGNLNIPYHFRTNDGYTYDEEGTIFLGEWLYRQKKNENPETSRGKLLIQIGCNFNIKSNLSWDEMYEYAKAYYKHHGNLEIPCRFKTDDGYTYKEDGKINLGRWLLFQRLRLDHNSNRVKLLMKIGMRFEVKKTKSWDEMFELVQIYYNHHHNLDMPSLFKTNDGYTYDANGSINLGRWLGTQRIELDPQSSRGLLLANLGLKFEHKIKNRRSWDEMYEYTKIYFDHHGNLEIPSRFKTDDGYTYKEDGEINLGVWILNQRKLLTPDNPKYKKLAQIGMRFNRSNLIWEEIYYYAKVYYTHHGNLEVPLNFKTDDGYTFKKDGKVSLGNWIASQRKRVAPDSERGKLLSQIGMRFNRSNLSWDEMYEYAKIYFVYHGNLELKYKFKTNDGYTYKEDGTIKLGEWVYYQRRNIKPDSNHGLLLNKIGLIWDKEKNNAENKLICAKYNIDYELNKSFLSFISTPIFALKINFLLENNMPLTDDKGLLLNIFYLNSFDIKKIYDIDIEELIKAKYPLPETLGRN